MWQWQIVLWNVIIETDRRLLDLLLHKSGKLCFASVLHGSYCGYHFIMHDDLGSKHIQVITVFRERLSWFFKWTDHTIEMWCKGRCQWWLASILDSNARGVNWVPRADQVQVWKWCAGNCNRSAANLYAQNYVSAQDNASEMISTRSKMDGKRLVACYGCQLIPKIIEMSSFELLNSWNQHIKIYLCTKFQRLAAFSTQDSYHQCFVMVAILEFKMAAIRFVRHFKLIHCWT